MDDARTKNEEGGSGMKHETHEVPVGPEAVVAAFLAAIEARDTDAAIELLADDVEYDNVPIGKVRGRAAVAEILGPLLAACSEVHWPVARQSATNSTVFNERLDRFLMPHGWVELPVTGVWEVVDGRITLWRDYFDEATYRRQLPQKETDHG